MTEINPQNQNLLPFKKETETIEIRRLDKRWVTALSNPYKASPKHRNSLVELTYHELLKSAKSLYSQLQSTSERTVFEKDYRYDNSESSLAMHSFLTSSCYLHLECSFDYLYRIQYDFHDCPFEKELMEQIDLREHYNHGSCKQWQTKPNCKEFFERVIKVQDVKFIRVLPHIVINS